MQLFVDVFWITLYLSMHPVSATTPAETIPVVHPSPYHFANEYVFVCLDIETARYIVGGMISEDPSENATCGMAEAGRVTFVGVPLGEPEHALVGEGYMDYVHFYSVQASACLRSFIMAWPYQVDEHLYHPDYIGEYGLEAPLLEFGFPGEACVEEREEPSEEEQLLASGGAPT